VWQSASLTLSGTAVTNNTAAGGDGGGVWASAVGAVVLASVSVSENYAQGSGSNGSGGSG
jgi:hypothetical protein